MSENKNLTREEIPFRAYTFCGVECIDTRSPRHHGWGREVAEEDSPREAAEGRKEMSEKTHAELIKEMNCGPIPEHRHDREILRYYAYELDAAHKREMDDLRQLRDVLGKRAEKNLERCAELDAEVAAKDEVIKRLNDALAEEQRRKMATTEKSSTVGDCAKLREAVKAVVDVGYPHNFQKEAPHIRGYCYDITRAIEKCFAALAAPARNCDVGTAMEQGERFSAYCRAHKHPESECLPCPLFGQTGGYCELAWAQLTYKKGETK